MDRANKVSRWRDEIGITPDHFKAGNDRNASTKTVLDVTLA